MPGFVAGRARFSLLKARSKCTNYLQDPDREALAEMPKRVFHNNELTHSLKRVIHLRFVCRARIQASTEWRGKDLTVVWRDSTRLTF